MGCASVWWRFVSVVIPLLCSPAFAQVGDSTPIDSGRDETAAVVSGNIGQPPTPDPRAGHSPHGDAFDGGPRQFAYLLGGTGKVSFPITTKTSLAQQFFDQGVGQLHGSWNWEAERSFRQVAHLDDECAMAYWGMALANLDDPSRAQKFISEAMKRREKVTRREKLYIEAIADYFDDSPTRETDPQPSDNAVQAAEKIRKDAFLKKLEAIVGEFPGDIEAKAFLVHFRWTWRDSVPIDNPESVDSLLKQIFEIEPMHPAHADRIRLWVDVDPPRALASAAVCGRAAPSIAHMWHVPGHVYSKLERYLDAAYQQEASARVDHFYMMRDRVAPYRIPNYAHNNQWLVRTLLKVGRVNDALLAAKNLVEVPRHPGLNMPSRRASAAYYGRERLFETLILYELWNEYIRLADTPYLRFENSDEEVVRRIRWLGAAHLSAGNRIQGGEQMAELQQRLNTLKEQSGKSGVPDASKAAEQQSKDATKVTAGPSQASAKEIEAIEKALAHLAGLQAAANGNHRVALDLYEKAGDLSKPFLAWANLQAGNRAKAETIAREATQAAKNEVYPLAVYVEVLHGLEKDELAKQAFEQLRRVAGTSDLKAPIFDRLADIAAQFGYPIDWRLPAKTPSDVGTRPPLAALGPLRWQPVPAARWIMPDADGQLVSLDDYAGKPVVLLFNLGNGCERCAKQLQAFAQLAPDFRQAGIQLVVVSTDPTTMLKKSIEAAKDSAAGRETESNHSDAATNAAVNRKIDDDGAESQVQTDADKAPTPFPFTIVSNNDLRLFKAYHCFDDFEQRPLHGTFLVDKDGLLRWQEVGAEPFNDAAFLLREAERLVKLPE